MSDDDCEICEHPFSWHGDRAVAACDGGWVSEGLRRPYKWGEPVSACSCSGWVEPVGRHPRPDNT